MSKLIIATCQFPLTRDPVANTEFVLRQMTSAKELGAQLTHFPECCLSGYAGVELASTAGIDWAALLNQAERVMAAAKRLGLWVVVGSTHRLSQDHKPHNSLYVIDNHGRLVTRYDKVFCTGRGGARPTEDLAHYSPGSSLITFEVRGVRIGLLICHDCRYPELYRQYKQQGVQLVLHSYHNAGMTADSLHYYHDHVTITMKAAAASNFLWISASNACQPSAWSSFVVSPSASIVGRLVRHRPGILVQEIDSKYKAFDPSSYWRKRCSSGVFHSGELVTDRRSDDRTSL